MKLKSIWLYVIVFIVVFLGSFLYMRMQATSGENFETFYDKFMTDSTFQISRIPFPIEGIPENPTDLDLINGFYWTQDNWDMQLELDYESQGFERELIDKGALKVEFIRVPGLAGMEFERRFMLMDGKWNLIYYAYPKGFNVNLPRPS